MIHSLIRYILIQKKNNNNKVRFQILNDIDVTNFILFDWHNRTGYINRLLHNYSYWYEYYYVIFLIPTEKGIKINGSTYQQALIS